MMRQASRKYLASRTIFLPTGDAHDRNAGAQAGINEPRHIVHRARLVLAADEDLDADAGGVEHRVVHVHGDLLVGQYLAQDARAAAGAQHHRLRRFRRHDRAQDSACAEQRVAGWKKRQDREIDALEPGGGALKVAVVDREQTVRPLAGENTRASRFFMPQSS